MTRKDKLQQTKKLADLWYQQQKKSDIYSATKREKGDLDVSSSR
ncbi:hypothetical protein AU086_gp42 [Enterococcus phage vB_EfaS_IME197]|nr:hypothetical protein AU086_gp42 [Enterococcus phage vB_EfaS_IME197]ALO80935.1 hypothetical protein [Enterococcus phage vB_EfaS_IME197]